MRNEKIIALCLGISTLMGVSLAAPYPEVGCTGLPSSDSCSQCFNAGGVYKGFSVIGIYDDFKNSSSDTYVYYDKDNPTPYTYQKLQPTTNWNISSGLFEYVNNSSYPYFRYTSNDGEKYHIFAPNYNDRYIQAKPNHGLQLSGINAGTDRNSPAFVLKIHTKYRKFLGNGQVGALNEHTECFYYYPNRCGDGVVDNDKGEQCDLGAQNGQPGSTCSSTCQTITLEQPACNSTYNGQTLDNLTESNTLCNPGTISNFTSTSAGRTWTCNGETGTTPAQCSATKKTPGALIIEKTLISPSLLTTTGETVKRKITITASGGAISNFSITEKVPDKLTFSGRNTLSSPFPLPNPSIANNGKTITRNTTGTLAQNEKIELEISTTLQKVPQPHETIINIACVSSGSTEICDNAGTSTIEKTLIGSGIVTKTGDIVEWKIAVKANSGALSTFKIIDTLPDELAYDSYSVLSAPSSVTIGNPTGTSSKTITRQVNGTLAENQTIELKVITKVTKLPPADASINNIACLQINTSELCDDASAGTPSITKTLIGSGIVSFTGETLIWEITARPNGGAIEDFQFIENFVIVDGLPVQLAYSGYEVTHNPGVTVQIPTTGTTSTGSWVKWQVNGKIEGNEYLTLRVITTVVQMPTANETIKNIACLIIDTNKQICDEAETQDVVAPDLRIKKTFIDGTAKSKTYHPGDFVGYKIAFGNNGNGIATEVILTDFLPQNLSFESIQLESSPEITYVHSGYYSDGVRVEKYTTMTLPPHSAGYLLLTGKVLDTYTDSTLNVACIIYSTDRKCSEVLYTTDQPSLTIDKTVNTSVVNLNDEVIFTITITNNSNIPLSGFTITDTLPAYLEFERVVSAPGFEGGSYNAQGRKIIWTHPGVLQPNASVRIEFEATVTRVEIPQTNTACVTHPDISEQCDESEVEAQEEQFCLPPSVQSTIWANTAGSGSAEVTCNTSNGGNATITIRCGDGGGTYTENNVSSLTRTCEYKMSGSIDETRTPVCEVNNSSYDQSNRKCQTSITLRKDRRTDIGYCGDREATDWEDCDCTNSSKNCTTAGADLNRDRLSNSEIKKYEKSTAYSCKNCKIVDDEHPKGAVTPIACFNVNNGSISINKGEMLPFYRNIEKVDEKYYTEDTDYDDGLLAYENLSKKNCNEDDEGKIPLNAMVCTFRVYNGNNLQSQEKFVYELKVPCFTKGTNIQTDWTSSRLISSFISWNQNNYIKDGNANGGNTFWSYNITSNSRPFAFRSSVFIIDNFGTKTDNKFIGNGKDEREIWANGEVKTFGEYKLSLDAVDYLQCNNGRWEKQDPYPRVCEVNFSVTEPYILQKTPSGTITQTTESLKNFKMYADGTNIMENSELNKILTVNPNNFSDTTQISAAMEKFIAKYSKLAVKLNSSLFGSTSVKKVPGKNIYFVDGDLNIDGFQYEYDASKTKIKETPGTNAIYDKPFTIVQTKGNTTIKGNLNHNMMLLTNGTITFDGSKNCNDAQTLKGIYYAKNRFISTGISKNNRLENIERCIGGNLHIKGIAIGDGLNTVMEKRRSNLNERFTAPGTTTTAKAMRRNYIMNGAAVLIEYSPSIFTTATMPPGAEEFTKALEVYKR